MSRCQLPGSAAWSEDQLTLPFPSYHARCSSGSEMFRGSPPNNVKAEIHASSKRLPPQRRHSCSSNSPNAPYRTPAALFTPLPVSSSAEFVCPLPLCSAFAYYRLCNAFIILGVLSRIWNINLNAFSRRVLMSVTYPSNPV